MRDRSYLRASQPSERSAETYLKSVSAIFEETGDKKGQARALQSLAVAYDTERRHELAVQYYEKSLALSQEVGDRNLTALIFNGLGMAHTNRWATMKSVSTFYHKARALSEDWRQEHAQHGAEQYRHALSRPGPLR